MKGRWNSSIDISKVLSCLILYIETTFPTMWPKKSLVRSDKYWQYLLVHEFFFTGSRQALMSSSGNRLMQDIRFNNDAFTYWIYLMIDVKVNGLKINLKIGVSNVFNDFRNKFVSAHCIVTSNVLTVTDVYHKRFIFPISPVNVYFLNNFNYTCNLLHLLVWLLFSLSPPPSLLYQGSSWLNPLILYPTEI